MDRQWLDDFFTLDAGRQPTMSGPGPLAVSEILDFCKNARGIAFFSERLKYVRVIQRLDAAYLNYWHEKNNKAAGTQ